MIVIREAKENDIESIYNHLNRKYVQKYYRGLEEQAKYEYFQWYKYMIYSNEYILFTVEDLRKVYLGNLKIEIKPDKQSAEISIFLVEKIREKGYSPILVEAAIEELKFMKASIKYIEAFILEENTKSIKCFIKCGFKYCGKVENKGIEYLLFRKKVE